MSGRSDTAAIRGRRASVLAGGALLALLPLLIAACGDDGPVAAVKPTPLTRDHRGHYCRMIVLDHKGPKGQIYLKGRAPLFFSSVRDTIAFTMLPEESKQIAAIFVNDMSRTSWDRPAPDTWIDARKAHFVIGSSKRGGMGAPEAVPFKTAAAAQKFAGKFGGTVVAFRAIPRPYILGDGAGEKGRQVPGMTKKPDTKTESAK